jgi:DNA polymerase-3 subunit epsilon
MSGDAGHVSGMTDQPIGRPPGAPPAASRRRPWREEGLVALDFETTGLDLEADSVISWGTAPVVDGGIELRDATYRLVAPGRPPGPDSIRVHELRPVDLSSAPPLSEAAPDLRAALDGRFVLAWAAGIELAFLRRMFGGSKRSWKRRMIDVRDLLLANADGDPDARRLTLESACRRFGVPVERTHHAFDDALMTAELFLVLAVRFGEAPTVRRLQHAARAAAAARR